jgi:F-type H+-transporting ATPase subunit epsilon
MSSGPWYRVAGWSYLRYANVCADLLRNVLKEPYKTKAASRQIISYRFSPFVEGKAGKQSKFVDDVLCNTKLCIIWI